MRGRQVRVAALGATLCFLGSVAGAGTIAGTVVYVGKEPHLRPISVAAEPICAKKHATIPNEMLVLGPGNAVANVLVHVVKGLPVGKTWPVPKKPVVLDQEGCQYVPHVMGIMVGQTFKILNSDGILHNVHALPRVNPPFNMAMPPARKEATATFARAEGMFTIRCDVHPWMHSYLGVFGDPFFAVTKKDGKFSIPGLSAGTYQIEAWHEKLGTRKATVTVGAGETKTVTFKFSPPTH